MKTGAGNNPAKKPLPCPALPWPGAKVGSPALTPTMPTLLEMEPHTRSPLGEREASGLAQAAPPSTTHAGGRTQRKRVVSQLWGLEAQEQGVSRVGFWEDLSSPARRQGAPRMSSRSPASVHMLTDRGTLVSLFF